MRSYPATVACRLTHADKEKLEQICDDRGITINEALRLGVTQLIRGHKGQTAVTESKPQEKKENKEQPRQTAVDPYEDVIDECKTKSGKYRCPGCGRYLKTRDGMKKHIDSCEMIQGW